jgi:hypothetical protein
VASVGVVSFHGVLVTPTPLKANNYQGKIFGAARS